MKDELCRDNTDWPIGIGFFVTVKPKAGKRYRGWVEAWDAKNRVLSVRDERTSNVRHTRPKFCTVRRPSSFQESRRIGYGKTSKAASKTARKNRRVKTGKKRTK